jgi:hypothetical protein
MDVRAGLAPVLKDFPKLGQAAKCVARDVDPVKLLWGYRMVAMHAAIGFMLLDESLGTHPIIPVTGFVVEISSLALSGG